MGEIDFCQCLARKEAQIRVDKGFVSKGRVKGSHCTAGGSRNAVSGQPSHGQAKTLRSHAEVRPYFDFGGAYSTRKVFSHKFLLTNQSHPKIEVNKLRD